MRKILALAVLVGGITLVAGSTAQADHRCYRNYGFRSYGYQPGYYSSYRGYSYPRSSFGFSYSRRGFGISIGSYPYSSFRQRGFRGSRNFRGFRGRRHHHH